MSNVHGDGLKQFQCDLCEKAYSSLPTLKLHQKNDHEGKFNFYCDVCNKGFEYMNRLQRHKETVHEGNNTFKNCAKNVGKMLQILFLKFQV